MLRGDAYGQYCPMLQAWHVFEEEAPELGENVPPGQGIGSIVL
jgi:hypothetical protein